MGWFTILLMIQLVIAVIHGATAGAQLQVGFYESSCSSAESIVKSAVQSAVIADRTIAASLIRLHFHDCFVQGCDGSILLTGSGTEQTATPNLSVRGFRVINDAKAMLEAACPGVVSCADIVALAARDSVVILGGADYGAETGRFDGPGPGSVVNLPGPDMSVDEVTPFFTDLGLTLADMVTLTGAHTVGVSQCQFIVNRLYNFQGTGAPDPSLDTTFLATLQSACPNVTGDVTNVVALDENSEFMFDSSYFRNLQANKGVLRIDQDIGNHASTSGRVNTLAAAAPSLSTFAAEFGASMVAMGRIGVLTTGTVRSDCQIA